MGRVYPAGQFTGGAHCKVVIGCIDANFLKHILADRSRCAQETQGDASKPKNHSWPMSEPLSPRFRIFPPRSEFNPSSLDLRCATSSYASQLAAYHLGTHENHFKKLVLARTRLNLSQSCTFLLILYLMRSKLFLWNHLQDPSKF